MPRAILVLVSAMGGTLCAQDTTELLNRMKAMEDRIKSLESELQAVKGQQAALTAAMTAAQPSTPQSPTPAPAQAATAQAPAAQATAGEPTAPPALGGLGGAAAKALNPDISVIGDF